MDECFPRLAEVTRVAHSLGPLSYPDGHEIAKSPVVKAGTGIKTFSHGLGESTTKPLRAQKILQHTTFTIVDQNKLNIL
jgi:hypothetical protein